MNDIREIPKPVSPGAPRVIPAPIVADLGTHDSADDDFPFDMSVPLVDEPPPIDWDLEDWPTTGW